VDSVRAPDPGFPFVSRTIDAYVRLDLRAEYELRRDRASIAVGVRNLLDDHHPEGTSAFFNSAEVPRMVYAELRLAIPAPGASPRAADAETP
jgi:outer membrane receptor protein involved in Fe transport